VSIELVVDACREQNIFVQRFKDINLEIPAVEIKPTLFDCIGGLLASGEKRLTHVPWEEETMQPVNNIFIRNYACQYGAMTDATYKIGFA